MSIFYTPGAVAFLDIQTPKPGKSDWGIDTLVRRVKGARSGMDTYMAGLSQGLGYTWAGAAFYLQTWEPDEDVIWGTVTLNYKGLRFGIPNAVALNSITQQSATLSADFHTQNGGKGYQYGLDGTGAPAYALGATRDFSYFAPQTTWRYIRAGRPNGPTYSDIGFSRSPQVIRSRITTSDGTVFGGNAPAGLVTALAVPSNLAILQSHSSSPIYGTPYWECEDVIMRGFIST